VEIGERVAFGQGRALAGGVEAGGHEIGLKVVALGHMDKPLVQGRQWPRAVAR
jgi:hypothetical protein